MIRGIAWNTFGIWAQKAFGFIAAIFLARLLTPSDYAIAGLAGAAMGIFRILIAHGFGYAIVQREELDDISCHSIFWFLSFAGLALGGTVVLLASQVAKFYNSFALVAVIRVLSLSLMIGMASIVPRSLLQRAMRFREINLLAVLGSGIGSLLGVGMAFLGFGYWALIVPGLGASLFVSIFTFRISGYRPKLAFEWMEIKRASNFGFLLTLSGLLYYLMRNVDYLIMGRFWSKADFGQYYFAFEKHSRPSQMLIRQISGVLLPGFSRLQNDLNRFRSAFLRATHDLCMIVYPIHVLLIGLADPLIPWIFGNQWGPSVPIFRIFFLHALLVIPNTFSSNVRIALNRPHFSLYISVLVVSTTLLVVLWLGKIGAGIVETATCLLFIWVLSVPIDLGYSLRLMHLSWKELWCNLKGLVGITIMMALALVACRVIAHASGWPTWLMVLMATLLPSALYLFLTRHLIAGLFKKIRSAFVK